MTFPFPNDTFVTHNITTYNLTMSMFACFSKILHLPSHLVLINADFYKKIYSFLWLALGRSHSGSSDSNRPVASLSIQGKHRGAVWELVEPGEAICQPQPTSPLAVQLRAEDSDEGSGPGRLCTNGLWCQAAVLGWGVLIRVEVLKWFTD